MPALTALLNHKIRELAQRESRAQSAAMKKMETRQLREIAALKRSIRQVTARLEKLENRSPASAPAPAGQPADGMRFRVNGLKSHRNRLGLSALDFGKLIGVSGLTIYNWESAKSRPRRSQLVKIDAIRRIGKRIAVKRLAAMDKA